jgi:hypothetical protein
LHSVAIGGGVHPIKPKDAKEQASFATITTGLLLSLSAIKERGTFLHRKYVLALPFSDAFPTGPSIRAMSLRFSICILTITGAESGEATRVSSPNPAEARHDCLPVFVKARRK